MTLTTAVVLEVHERDSSDGVYGWVLAQMETILMRETRRQLSEPVSLTISTCPRTETDAVLYHSILLSTRNVIVSLSTRLRVVIVDEDVEERTQGDVG